MANFARYGFTRLRFAWLLRQMRAFIACEMASAREAMEYDPDEAREWLREVYHFALSFEDTIAPQCQLPWQRFLAYTRDVLTPETIEAFSPRFGTRWPRRSWSQRQADRRERRWFAELAQGLRQAGDEHLAKSLAEFENRLDEQSLRELTQVERVRATAVVGMARMLSLPEPFYTQLMAAQRALGADARLA